MGVHIWEVSDEQAFILGHNCCGRHRDCCIRAVFSEHVEPQSVRDAASAGFHVDHVTQFVVGVRADQSFDEFSLDAVSVLDRSDRGRPVIQFRHRHQYDAGACLEQFD